MAQRRRGTRSKRSKKHRKSKGKSNLNDNIFDFDEWIVKNEFMDIKHIFIKHELNTKPTLCTESKQFVMFVCDPLILQHNGLLQRVITAIQRLSIDDESLKSHLTELNAKKLFFEQLVKEYNRSIEQRESIQSAHIDIKHQIYLFFKTLRDAIDNKEKTLLDEIPTDIDKQIEDSMISESEKLIKTTQARLTKALSITDTNKGKQQIHTMINHKAEQHYFNTDGILSHNINLLQAAINANKQYIIKQPTFDPNTKQSKRIIDTIESIRLYGVSLDEPNANDTTQSTVINKDIITELSHRYKSQIKAYKEEISTLKTQQSNNHQKLFRKNLEYSDLEEKYNELQAIYTSLKSQYESVTYTKHKNVWHDTLDENQHPEKIKSYQNQLEQQQVKYDELEAKYKALEAQQEVSIINEEKQAVTIRHTTQQLNLLQSQFASAIYQFDDLQRKHNKLDVARRKLSNTLRRQIQRNESLSIKMDQLYLENQNNIELAEVRLKQLQSLEGQVCHKNNVIELKSKEIIDLQSRLVECGQDLQDITEDIKSMKHVQQNIVN